MSSSPANLGHPDADEPLALVRVFLIAACCLGLGSCHRNWTSVDLPDGTTLTDLLVVDLYAPFDRATLLRDAEDAYGAPRDFGSESKGKHYFFYKEYVGKHGRIRVYNEAYDGEEGWESAQWLEVYPGRLYLEDVIRKNYLSDFDRRDGQWKLSLMPRDCLWCLTLELDGKAITKIADLPP